MAAQKSPHKDNSNPDLTYMKGVQAFFHEAGIGKKRVAILCKQLRKFGGSISESFNDHVTHIIMSKTGKVDKLLKVLKLETVDDSVDIVNADWLSACFLSCKLCDVSPYLMQKKNAIQISSAKIEAGDDLTNQERTVLDKGFGQADVSAESQLNESSCVKKKSPLKPQRKRKLNESDEDTNDESSYTESEDEESVLASPVKQRVLPSKPEGAWVCTQPSTSSKNLNEHITEKLEILAKMYTNTQDRWRALGYQKAISSIKNYPKKIETSEEVKDLRFIGNRLAKKIAEILETGHLRRLDHMDPKMEVINTFNAVWGAGPKTAESWFGQGYRSLDDLRTKAELTYQQKIGLKFYEEFLEKISREEVEEIEKYIKDTACELTPGMEVVTCGSYRRGRKLCGDVDVLISNPDGRSHKGFLLRLIDALQKKGLITDDLITVDNDEQRKYMGVFKLPGASRMHRRLDIIVAPYCEWACALVHFTGSGRLNRSMRLLAKKKDMSLSEHGLREGVIRDGQEKVNKGTIIPVFSEEDVFRHLGLDYLQPHERDW